MLEDGVPRLAAEIELAYPEPRAAAHVRLTATDASGKVIGERMIRDAAPSGLTSFEMQLPAAIPGTCRIIASLDGRQEQLHGAEQTWEVIPRRSRRSYAQPSGFSGGQRSRDIPAGHVQQQHSA